MPFIETSAVIGPDSLMEMFGADDLPYLSTVSSAPVGEWRLDNEGNWRFWRYEEEDGR